MKTYDINFQITVPEDSEWFDTHDGNYRNIDPGPDAPYIVVPRDADIEQIETPIKEGYYIDRRDGELLKFSQGKWYDYRGNWGLLTHDEDAFGYLDYSADLNRD